MSEGSLRGTRLGATSYENDDHVIPADRIVVIDATTPPDEVTARIRAAVTTRFPELT